MTQPQPSHLLYYLAWLTNIHQLEKPEIPRKPIPFKAEEGLGGHIWAPPKPESPGPSRNTGVTPQMPTSKGEVLESEPHDQEGISPFLSLTQRK